MFAHGEVVFFHAFLRGIDGPVLIEQRQEGMTFEPFLLKQFWKGWQDKSGSEDTFEMKRME
jgi:hypothetical protein